MIHEGAHRYHNTKVRTRHIQLYIVTNIIIMGPLSSKIPEDAHSYITHKIADVVAIDTVILWTPANIMGPFIRATVNGQWCFNRTS